MASVSTTFLNTYRPAQLPKQKPVEVFYWTMLALAVLDVILLFWIANPFSKPDANVRLTEATEMGELYRPVVDSKPTPVGPVARKQPVRSKAAAR